LLYYSIIQQTKMQKPSPLLKRIMEVSTEVMLDMPKNKIRPYDRNNIVNAVAEAIELHKRTVDDRIVRVYGGSTKYLLCQQHYQHIKKNSPPDCKNMKMYPLAYIAVSDEKRDAAYIMNVEAYLADLLGRVFGYKNCCNPPSPALWETAIFADVFTVYIMIE